ncbi:MAG TPA: MFS transporter, partial [Slackia equolifaciens]|nr:MFS transporter [Slackia equolifaciens]
IVPPMACRQAFGQKDYANIYSIVATGLNVLSGFAALMYATLFDLTGGYQAAMVVMMVFYALVILMSMVIVPMGRKLWAKEA